MRQPKPLSATAYRDLRQLAIHAPRKCDQCHDDGLPASAEVVKVLEIIMYLNKALLGQKSALAALQAAAKWKEMNRGGRAHPRRGTAPHRSPDPSPGDDRPAPAVPRHALRVRGVLPVVLLVAMFTLYPLAFAVVTSLRGGAVQAVEHPVRRAPELPGRHPQGVLRQRLAAHAGLRPGRDPAGHRPRLRHRAPAQRAHAGRQRPQRDHPAALGHPHGGQRDSLGLDLQQQLRHL